MTSCAPFLLDLPEVILYSVLTYVAPPTDRASVLCHQIAPLDSAHRRAVENGLNSLWSTVYHDEYGPPNTAASSPPGARSSKRLRRSPKDRVRGAHLLLIDRTLVAHYALSEMAHSPRTSLTLARLRWLFREYGPALRVNQRADIGGTFLVEVCRARHVGEAVILRCARELVERRGALPDLASAAASPSPSPGRAGGPGDRGLTPLCIAAARGMPSVVGFLLGAGASLSLEGTGRFRLHSNPSRSVFGTFAPLGFARAMREKEVSNGAEASDLRSLDKCVHILSRAESEAARK